MYYWHSLPPILAHYAKALSLRGFPQAINGLKVFQYCLGVAAASVFYKNISGGYIILFQTDVENR